MAINAYQIGDLVRCTGTFTDDAGTDTDPAALTAKYRRNDDTVTTLTYGVSAAFVKLDTGVYYFDVNVNGAGTWHYGFYATGAGQAAGESRFEVEESALD